MPDITLQDLLNIEANSEEELEQKFVKFIATKMREAFELENLPDTFNYDSYLMGCIDQALSYDDFEAAHRLNLLRVHEGFQKWRNV